jgi:hypothetical protein
MNNPRFNDIDKSGKELSHGKKSYFNGFDGELGFANMSGISSLLI